MKQLLPLILLGVASTALAEEISVDMVDGRKFENVALSTKSPDGVTIFTETGVVKLAYADMTEESKSRLGYDPAKEAEAAERATQIKVAKAEADAKDSIWLPWTEYQKELKELYANEPMGIRQRGGTVEEAKAAGDRIEAEMAKIDRKLKGAKELVQVLRNLKVGEDSIREITNNILSEKVSIGMPRAAVMLSWGRPDSTDNHTNQYGKIIQWGYKKGRYDWSFVTFKDEFVASISE